MQRYKEQRSYRGESLLWEMMPSDKISEIDWLVGLLPHSMKVTGLILAGPFLSNVYMFDLRWITWSSFPLTKTQGRGHKLIKAPELPFQRVWDTNVCVQHTEGFVPPL